MCASLELILEHLSNRVVKILEAGKSLKHLIYLFEFLAGWKKRPADLTLVAYWWCTVVADAAKGLEADGGTNTQQARRLRLQDLTSGWVSDLSETAERGFNSVGSGFDLFRQGPPSGSPTSAALGDYTHLLFIALEIGFRRVAPSPGKKNPPLDRIHHHDWILKNVFSSDDDEVVADALSMWILYNHNISLNTFVDCFTKRMERHIPFSFSPRLRQVAISTIERVGLGEDVRDVGGSGMARALNHLIIDEGEVVNKSGWATLLVNVIRSPQGPEDLSSHCWDLLDRLMLTGNLTISPAAERDLEVMELLKEAEKWEELEVWMVIMWLSPVEPDAKSIKRIEEVTRELLSQRPSVLQKYENLSKSGRLHRSCKVKLGRICEQVKQVLLTPP